MLARVALRDGTLAARGFHAYSALVAGAPGEIRAVGAVYEGDVVPEGVGDGVFELGNSWMNQRCGKGMIKSNGCDWGMMRDGGREKLDLKDWEFEG